MTAIDPNKEYSIQEVVDNQFIPHIKGYSGLYNLVTVKVLDESKKWADGTIKEKYVRALVPETTLTALKPVDSKAGWRKISGKITIQGLEILKFLKAHNII